MAEIMLIKKGFRPLFLTLVSRGISARRVFQHLRLVFQDNT